ncbi:MAG: universal stress protein [Cyanobacteria bacterium P01_D01_bin.1]
MIKRILTGLDYRDTCQEVFEQTLDLALATQSTLKLVNVIAFEKDDSVLFPPYSDADWSTYKAQYQELETKSSQLLGEFVNKAREAGIATESAQQVGNAGPVICQLGSDWQADLITVGSHGKKGLREMLLGSVSNYVVHHATCSVMVVHRPDR